MISVQITNLTHYYPIPNGNPLPVVQVDSWTLRPGDQVLLRGVSGSGKTTLLNILAGLMPPTSGEVRYGDQSLYALPEAARDRFRAAHIGYIFQAHNLLGLLTAAENVILPLAFARRVPRNQWQERAARLLDAVDLGDRQHYRPNQLSTGQRMRVAVARALACDPGVLLADEPTAALDSANANRVMDLLQEVSVRSGASLVVASHDPAVAVRFAKVADIHNGTVTFGETEPA